MWTAEGQRESGLLVESSSCLLVWLRKLAGNFKHIHENSSLTNEVAKRHPPDELHVNEVWMSSLLHVDVHDMDAGAKIGPRSNPSTPARVEPANTRDEAADFLPEPTAPHFALNQPSVSAQEDTLAKFKQVFDTVCLFPLPPLFRTHELSLALSLTLCLAHSDCFVRLQACATSQWQALIEMAPEVTASVSFCCSCQLLALAVPQMKQTTGH